MMLHLLENLTKTFKHSYRFVFTIWLVLSLVLPVNMLSIKKVKAAESISIISDLEMESFVFNIINPIFDVAKLDKTGVGIYIIADPNINAFVYNNSVFINTGLLIFASDTDAIFGVLAHETGHLVRKHITRMAIRSTNDYKQVGASLVGSLLLLAALGPVGLGAAFLPALAVIPMISLSALMQNKLRYSRENESEADESAITYLNKMGHSVGGLYGTMSFFNENMDPNARLFSYMYTHPLPEERLERLRTIYQRENKKKIKPVNCELEIQLRRIQAKILGYFGETKFETRHKIDRKGECFKAEDIKFFRDYQKMHELWQNGKIEEAIKLADNLTSGNYAEDLFLIESKANLLFANGNVEDAIALYRIVVERSSPQLYLSASSALAKMLASSSNIDLIKKSIEMSKNLAQEDNQNPIHYARLSFAYGKLGDLTLSRMYAAESSLRMNDCPSTLKYTNMALKSLKKSTREDEQKIKDTCQDLLDACPPKKKFFEKKAK